MPLIFSKDQWDSLIAGFAQPLAMPLLRFLWSLTKRMVPLFVILTIALSLLLSSYQFFRQWRDRPVKLFVGPVGTADESQADDIEQELRKQSFWGPNYYISQTLPTDGSMRNLRRVNKDSEGDILAIATEGMELDDTANVRTLVPLDWCFLHFLFRNQSLSKIGMDIPAARQNTLPPISFSDWAIHVRNAKLKTNTLSTNELSTTQIDSTNLPVRLYLGPAESGTRHLANLVLQYGKISADIWEEADIDDFEDMARALKRDAIDGAFILGPIKSGIVEQIADDGQCTLISIDKAASLAAAMPFLSHGTIKPYTYSFSNDDAFLGDVETLAVRRVVIASNYMSNNNAYHLANYIRSALPAQAAVRNSSGYWLGPNGETSERSLNYDLHAGVTSGDQVAPVFSWVSRNAPWFLSLVFALVISLVTELRKVIGDWLVRHPADGLANQNVGDDGHAAGSEDLSPAPGANGQPPVARPVDRAAPNIPRSTTYAEIDAEIDRILKEIHDAADELIPRNQAPSGNALVNWRRQTGDIYRQVHAATKAKDLSASQSLKLKERAFLLQQEIEFLRNPPWHTPAPQKRRATKPKQKRSDGNDSERNS